jgi:hypothetical protein
VPIVPISLGPLTEWAIWTRAPVRKSVALPFLAGRKASAIGPALTLGLIGRSIAERLRGVRRYARLRLETLLWLLISVRSLRRRRETIRQRTEIAIVFQVVLGLAKRPLLTALRERLRSLRSRNKPEIMFGVL